jgi:hypothetical protein
LQSQSCSLTSMLKYSALPTNPQSSPTSTRV